MPRREIDHIELAEQMMRDLEDSRRNDVLDLQVRIALLGAATTLAVAKEIRDLRLEIKNAK